MKAKLLENLKHLPSTIAGIGAFLTALPQIPAIQQVAGISPALATKITGVGALGAALTLIFGVRANTPTQ